MLSRDVLLPQGFVEELGVVFTKWVQSHPNPDVPSMRFIGENSSGQLGVTPEMTPRQYAQEIVDQTPFGLKIAQNHLEISKNLGDGTGQRVLRDLREMGNSAEKKREEEKNTKK